jgi:LacI family transcriptional regulator
MVRDINANRFAHRITRAKFAPQGGNWSAMPPARLLVFLESNNLADRESHENNLSLSNIRPLLSFSTRLTNKRTSASTRRSPYASPFRVGVLLWLNHDYGRRVLVGIEEYTRKRGTLRTQLIALPAGDTGATHDLIRQMHGVIAVLGHVETTYWRNRISAPFIEVPLFGHRAPDRTTVTTDSREIGRLGAKHLLSLGLRSLAVCHDGHADEVDRIREGVTEAAAAIGATVAMIPRSTEIHPSTGALFNLSPFPVPIPAGVLCSRDAVAQRVIREAQAAGLRVPQDLAVLGLGNDPVYCVSSSPAMSSVSVASEIIGARAAACMERILSGHHEPSVLLHPLGVAMRDSTNMAATRDLHVRAALCFIHANIRHAVSISAIASHSGLPRHVLDYRFKKILGISVHQELTRRRLELARELLTGTQDAIKVVAASVGGMGVANFCRFMKEHTGLSPSAYRERHHGQTGNL